MYNRYIGNTGKFYRVNDEENNRTRSEIRPVAQAAAFSFADEPLTQTRSGGFLDNIKLPFGLKTADLTLLLLFLFLFLQSGDDEFLILLAAVVVVGIL